MRRRNASPGGPRGAWYWSVLRRIIWVPFASAFVLGLAALVLGAAFAVGELPWDMEGKVGRARVVDKYIRPPSGQLCGRPATPCEVGSNTRVVFELETNGAVLRGDVHYPWWLGWKDLDIGDQIEIEYLPSGDFRSPQDSSATGWLVLAAIGLALTAVGGGVALALTLTERRAGRLTDEAIAGAFSGQS